MADNKNTPRKREIKVKFNISWIYILLLFGIGWMFFSQKSANPQKEEWDAVSEPETGGIISSFAEKPTAQPAEKPVETVKQVNIYVYSASGRKRLCTYCDGENDMTATKCRVCGQMIK